MATYRIVGADQKEYGPVSEEQLRQWIIEGRANAQTVVRADEGPWKPLGTYPEFAAALGIAPATDSSGIPPLSAPPPVPPLPRMTSTGPVQTNPMAIAGLICSILGLFCCGPIFSTLGLIFSVMAIYQINQNPSRFGGKQVAIAGVVLGVIGYAIFAVLIMTGIYRHAFRRLPRFF
jgi:hypothetical protein